VHKSRIQLHGAHLSADSKSHLVKQEHFSPSWTKTVYFRVHRSMKVAMGTLLRAKQMQFTS